MTERILVISAQYPLPLHSGGQVRVAYLVRELARRFRVSLTGLYPSMGREAPPENIDSCEVCLPVPVTSGRRAPLRRLSELGAGLIRGVPPAVGRYRRGELQRAIESMGGIDSFDAVICEYTAAALYLPPRVRQRTLAVLDEIDLSYVPLERLAANRRGVPRLVTRLHASWMRRYETKLFDSFDAVAVTSDRDLRRVNSLTPRATTWKIPNGVSLKGVPERPIASRPPAFVFLGGMRHLPNLDAVRWLVSEIFPCIRARLPAAELILVGEGTEQFSDARRAVRGLGFAEDLSDVLAPGDVALAPIRIAGGTRLKLLDYMARGVPAISTAIGAEGLEVTSGEHLLIADRAAEIADRAADLFARTELQAIVAKKARQLIEERYDWETIGATFADLVGQALDKRGTRSPGVAVTSQTPARSRRERAKSSPPKVKAPGRIRRRLARWGASHFPSGYAPNPIRIMFMLTHRCNQRCAVCAQWGDVGVKKSFGRERLSNELELADYERILDDVAPFHPLVLLSGGEITLYKDWVRVVEAVKARGLFAEVYTNGMTLATAADRVVAAGLDHIKISIDGPAEIHDELRGVRGAFARAAEGAREVIEARRRVGAQTPVVDVACVISERNASHLQALLREVEAWGVDGIDFAHWNFLSSQKIEDHLQRFRDDFGIVRDDCWAGLRCDAPIDYAERCVSVARELRKAGTRLSVNCFPDFGDADIRGYYGDEDYIPRVTEPVCVAPWLNAVVEPEGEFTICPNYSLGDVRDAGFEALWNNPRARLIRTNLRRKGPFAGCTKCCWYYIY